MKHRIIVLLLLILAAPAMGQSPYGAIKVAKHLDYRQRVTPIMADDHLGVAYFADKSSVYTMKGQEIFIAKYDIRSLKVSPNGSTIAILSSSKKNSNITVHHLYRDEEIFHINNTNDNGGLLSAVCYSHDGRYIYYAAGGIIKKASLQDFSKQGSSPTGTIPTGMTYNPNGLHILAWDADHVSVFDAATLTEVNSIWRSGIKSAAYSDDGKRLAVAWGVGDNGIVDIFDARGYSLLSSATNLGKASSVSFHRDGKYFAVNESAERVLVVNAMNPSERYSLSEPNGGISFVRFMKDNLKNVYLSYSATNSLKSKMVTDFTPNYTNMMQDELTARMMEWAMVRNNETMFEYQMRVNDDTRMQQARLFEEEIATEMAVGLVERSTITLGSYDPVKGTVELSFDNLAPVSLSMSAADAASFSDPMQLEFRDAVYGLDANDNFELVYANIYNKQSGKNYRYDVRSQHSIDYLKLEDNMVSMELVQLSGQDGVKLKRIKDEVLINAKKNRVISDHTVIDVNTGVFISSDVKGKKINNYKVGFKYEVEGSFSLTDDFPAGKYKIEDSKAALSMLDIVLKAFSDQFAKYMQPGKKVEVRITGSADAIPIKGLINYDGCYGDFIDEPCYIGGFLNSMNVTRQSAIRTNEQLAYVRAASLREYLKKQLQGLKEMDSNFVMDINVSDKTGGQYRRIDVEFVFIDAFAE